MSKLEIYKFGGASVKDAKSIKNLASIIAKSEIANKLVIVVSAIGKTTNHLEEILKLAHKNNDFEPKFKELVKYHVDISKELLIYDESLEEQFSLLHTVLEQCNRYPFSYSYDQVVSFGELISTKMVSQYLNHINIKNEWIDARKCILTDNKYQEGTVNWQWSGIFCKKNLSPILENQIIVTQGFIGSDSEGNTTTLGREGSDFSAAIFATSLQANSVTIWKDVDGLLNADPKKFINTTVYDEVPIQEVIEMSYYGATVIHPKTLKPLANNNIPLYVKSFIKPQNKGTKIYNCRVDKIAPSYILKENQALISFSKKDLSFMEEDNVILLFNALYTNNFKLNLIQKSALSFSIICNADEEKISKFTETINEEFSASYNIGLQLITIKNYNSEKIPDDINYTEILLKQQSRTNLQYLIK